MKLETKQKLGNKIFGKVLFILFLAFLTLYVSQAAGYYEYQNSKKTSFTQEQIDKFEQDVKDGKEIDITDYITNTNKDYQNKLSASALSISEIISKYTKGGIEKIFTALGSAME